MKNKNLFFLLILITLLLTSAQTTFACTFISRTPQKSFNTAGTVFSGKVISIATSTEVVVYDGTKIPTKISTMIFKVEKYWKGNPTEYVTVKSTALDGYSCPIFIPKAVGGEYLIYATKDTNSNSYFVEFPEIKEKKSANADLVFLGNGHVINAPIKTETNNSKPAPKPVVDVKPTSTVKTTSTVVSTPDQKLEVNDVEIKTNTEVKQGFIQKIISWFGGLLMK